jgi:hypothetical protein
MKRPGCGEPPPCSRTRRVPRHACLGPVLDLADGSAPLQPAEDMFLSRAGAEVQTLAGANCRSSQRD